MGSDEHYPSDTADKQKPQHLHQSEVGEYWRVVASQKKKREKKEEARNINNTFRDLFSGHWIQWLELRLTSPRHQRYTTEHKQTYIMPNELIFSSSFFSLFFFIAVPWTDDTVTRTCHNVCICGYEQVPCMMFHCFPSVIVESSSCPTISSFAQWLIRRICKQDEL